MTTNESKLRDFFAIYAPQKLSTIGIVLEKYKGREDTLFLFLQKKYSEAIRQRELAEVDFCSALFNPAKALAQPGLLPPNQRVRPLDNLRKCRCLLPASDVEYAPMRSTLLPGQKATNASSMESKQAQKKKSIKEKLPHMKIAEHLKEGPHSLLYKCLHSNTKVIVTMRRAGGVRGTCTARVKAFDKHLNMILTDVTEVFTVFLKTKKKPAHQNIDHGSETRFESENSIKIYSNVDSSSNQLEHTENNSTHILRGDFGSVESEADIMNALSYWQNREKDNHQDIEMETRQAKRFIKTLLVRGDNVIMIRQLIPARKANKKSKTKKSNQGYYETKHF